MNKQSIVISKLIEQFRIALAAGLEGLKNAAEAYAQALDVDPKAEYQFRTEFQGKVPETAWATLAQVGRKELHPSLMLGCVPNSRQIRRLPFHQQKKYLDTKATVELATPSGVMRARPTDLKREQAEQVFDHGKIRTIEEQEVYAKAVATKTVVPKGPDYTIKNNRVYFWYNTNLSKAELQDIIKELV